MLDSLAEVVRRLDPSRTVLFLGAGASIPSGAPTALDLLSLLCQRTNVEVPSGIGLGEGAQILELKVGRKRLVEALIALLGVLKPDTSYEALASYPWRAIFTTNFDCLIEREFARQGKPLHVVRSHFDYATSHLNSTVLYKIHGCLTQDEALGHQSRLILTTDDYDQALAYRQNLFRQLATHLTTADVVFLGYSISDPDITGVLKSAIEENRRSGGNGRLHGIFYQVTQEQAQIWRGRGFQHICQGDLPSFASALGSIPQTVADAPVDSGDWLHLDPQIAPSVIRVRQTEGNANAKRLFSGSSATYADIRSGLTFERDAEVQLVGDSSKLLYTIVGVAGTGKTTLVRRALLSLAQDPKNECLELRLDSPGDVAIWRDLERFASAKGKTVFLFVDNLPSQLRWINELIGGLPSNSALKLVGTAEPSQWTIRQKHRKFHDAQFAVTVDTGKLSRSELRKLVDLVLRNNELRSLASAVGRLGDRITIEDALSVKCARDFFVSLKLIFSNETLDHIILGEFNEIPEPAKSIYRMVCGLQAAGGDPHRQLVLRMAKANSSEVPALMRVLDGLLSEELAGRNGVFVWAARHLVVARVLAKYKYSSDEELVDLLSDFIEEVNPAQYSEARFLREVCNSEFGIKKIASVDMRIRLYGRIVQLWPAERVAHHRLIGDLLQAGRLGEAESELESARRTIGVDPPVARYGVRLLVKRSKVENLEDRDRRALLRRAQEECVNAIGKFPEAKHITFTSGEIADAWYELTGSRELYDWAYQLHEVASEKLLDPEISSKAVRLLRERESAGH